MEVYNNKIMRSENCQRNLIVLLLTLFRNDFTRVHDDKHTSTSTYVKSALTISPPCRWGVGLRNVSGAS